ncbi:putative PEP-binding protein [Vibrio brasiliensis]
MSLTRSSSIHPALNLGDSLPQLDQATSGSHLFVSLSEMILEHVFYHPDHAAILPSLDESEVASINAILGEQSLELHFVSTLTEQILAAVKPQHQSVRIDLGGADSYSFRTLLGGQLEPTEVNPALGLRGVSRFAHEKFVQLFTLECQVIKVLQQQGCDVEIVVPFVRGLSDAAKVIDLLAEQGLPRGLNGLKVLYTVDVPSGALLSERLLHYFDGLVINVENLAQFTLGVDRLSEELEYLFDPESEAVMMLIEQAVDAATNSNKPIVLVSNGLVQYARLQEYIVEHPQIDVLVTL